MKKVLLLIIWLLCLVLSTASASRLPIRGLRGIGKHIGDLCVLLNLFGNVTDCELALGMNSLPGSTLPTADISSSSRLVNFTIGDTRQRVSLIADTTIDLTFVLCEPCEDCRTQSEVTVYNSSGSDSFAKYRCGHSTTDPCRTSQYTKCSADSCTYVYEDYPSTTSKGFLGTDTFFWSDDQPAAPLVFGCGTANTGYYGNAVGYLGLGLGNLSFVSQMKATVFSYCFSSDASDDSFFFFGPDVRVRTASSSTIKLLPNKRDPALYYVNLTGITVGEKRVDIPSTYFLPQADGCGGMVIDSAASLTLLEESAYHAVKREFIKQMQLPQVDASVYNLDLCFAVSSEDDDIAIPGLTLHFDGADMNPSNYLVKDSDGDGALCLMMLPAKGISILGNLMQVDMHMIFDVGNSVLRFESVNCRSL